VGPIRGTACAIDPAHDELRGKLSDRTQRALRSAGISRNLVAMSF
jgi:hypothetical protein